MSTKILMASSVVAALACGCAGPSESRRNADQVTISLAAAEQNRGQVSNAVLSPQGDRTSMLINISNVPPWVVRPVQLFTFIFEGSCAKRAASPAYSLNDVVLAGVAGASGTSGPFTLVKEVPAPLAKLTSGGYAIVIRTSPADGSVDMFCGDIK